jgi:hypothetical protein
VGQTSGREFCSELDEIKVSKARSLLYMLHVNAFCGSAYAAHGRMLDLVDDVPRHVLRSRLICHLLCDLLFGSARTFKVFRLGSTEISAMIPTDSIGPGKEEMVKTVRPVLTFRSACWPPRLPPRRGW